MYSVSRPLFVGGLSLELSGKGSLLRAYGMVIYIYIYVHICIHEYLKVIERGWKGERERERVKKNKYIYIYTVYCSATESRGSHSVERQVATPFLVPPLSRKAWALHRFRVQGFGKHSGPQFSV